MEKLELRNLAGGAVQERFNDEMQEVLNNIIDPNTDPKKTRKLTLDITIKPNEERDLAMIEFAVKKTLAPAKSIGSTIIIDRDVRGKAVAAETIKSLPGQMKIDDVIGQPNVLPMQKASS